MLDLNSNTETQIVGVPYGYGASNATARGGMSALWVIVGLIGLAILVWAFRKNHRDDEKNYCENKKTNGYLSAKVEDLEYGYKTVANREYDDAVAIAFMRGKDAGYPKHGDCNGGGEKFQIITKGKCDPSTFEMINECKNS